MVVRLSSIEACGSIRLQNCSSETGEIWSKSKGIRYGIHSVSVMVVSLIFCVSPCLFVMMIANAFYKKPIQDTADALDRDFHGLCHSLDISLCGLYWTLQWMERTLWLWMGVAVLVVRCPHKGFDVYCRYNDKFMCEFKLPKKEIYVVAWRRWTIPSLIWKYGFLQITIVCVYCVVW